MLKVFDYNHPKRGWVEFETYDFAKKYIDNEFDTFFYMDKDNSAYSVIEIYNDGVYEVWSLYCEGWLYLKDDEPYKEISKGTREDYIKYERSYFKFTNLDPKKDYILVSGKYI